MLATSIQSLLSDPSWWFSTVFVAMLVSIIAGIFVLLLPKILRKSGTKERTLATVLPDRDSNISTTIGDIVRWTVAIALLPISVTMFVASFNMIFNNLMEFSTKFSYFYHLLMWIPLTFLTILIPWSLGPIIKLFGFLLVRQRVAFSLIFLIVSCVLLIMNVVGIWMYNSFFPWQQLDHSTTNKIIFSYLSLQICGLSASIFESENKKTESKLEEKSNT